MTGSLKITGLKPTHQDSPANVLTPTSLGDIERGRTSLVRTALAGAEHSAANLTSG